MILCRNTLFYPNASIQTCIVLIQKNKNGHDFEKDKIEFKNYSDDGISIEKHIGTVKNSNFDNIFNDTLNNKGKEFFISNNSEWLLKESNSVLKINTKKMKLLKLEEEYLKSKKKLEESEDNEILTLTKPYKIKDIIEIVKNTNPVKLKECSKHYNSVSQYPVVSSSKRDNGISCFSETFSVENSFTINKNGSVGYCFYHPYKFNYTTDVICFRLKEEFLNSFDISFFTFVMTEIFTNSLYNYSYKLNITRFLNETILFK